jgi:hypothetical protein
MLTFMDKETYEQITLPARPARRAAAFLQDGHGRGDGALGRAPISVQLPDTIEATIVEADAVVKGPDRFLQLQAGHPRKRRPRDGPAAYRQRNPDRRGCLQPGICAPGRLIALPLMRSSRG